jgi:hypothetical protein
MQFSKTHSCMQTYVNSNNREIIRNIFYGVQLFIPVLLLRTLRFPEFKTCETTDELGWVIRPYCSLSFSHGKEIQTER